MINRHVMNMVALGAALVVGACSPAPESEEGDTDAGTAVGVLEVSMSVDLNVAPDELWALVGGFNSLADWHPAVAASELSEEGGETFRTLSLAGGDATILERLDAMNGDAMSYSYTIIEAPLPVDDYASTLAVTGGEEGGATLRWSSEFTAAGATDDEAKAAIAGIYGAGFEALKERFPGE